MKQKVTQKGGNNPSYSVRISVVVYEEIKRRGEFGETPDDVLRRIFKLSLRKPCKHRA